MAAVHWGTQKFVIDGKVLHLSQEAGTMETDPGAIVWECSLVMSHYLDYQNSIGNKLVAGKRCLELGAGRLLADGGLSSGRRLECARKDFLRKMHEWIKTIP